MILLRHRIRRYPIHPPHVIYRIRCGYLTIIPRARVGYEVKCRVGYNHLISNKREWNNCFIKNHQQILLDFADFAWLEQPEGNLMDAISRVWYNGSYTIAAKPIKTLELHYLYNDPVFNNSFYPLRTADSKIPGFAAELAGCVWTKSVSGKEKLRIQKYPDTRGRGLTCYTFLC